MEQAPELNPKSDERQHETLSKAPQHSTPPTHHISTQGRLFTQQTPPESIDQALDAICADLKNA